MRQDVILSTRMKKEVPDSSKAPPPDFLDGRKGSYDGIMWELKGILGMDHELDDDHENEEEEDYDHQVINVEGPSNKGGEDIDDHEYWDLLLKTDTNYGVEEEEEDYHHDHGILKRAPPSSSSSLKLSLNYQKVLDAWSDRGPLWADINTSSPAYMGEVPELMEVEGDEKRFNRIRRREASVLRYKEKRQSRFFSKKIRYQVRKLNADQRPRIKGRFVKRSPEKIFI
ncbi:zinc finger protein CONSTANS-LIKE 7 isoform X2 [Impatiens glandulifera]|uniref:zinc finger protein CONSTANS-LIKE 7 isoform X2 n=1 Tax=Impatiens glandulifera TaxID=253017 RepID=UPI001FB1770D|nr:zinc finger protein CONSTANS-LIKE 7 isoform X2 [Impatiens glandulifera]